MDVGSFCGVCVWVGVFVGVCICGCGMLICLVSALGSHEMGRHKLPIIIIIKRKSVYTNISENSWFQRFGALLEKGVISILTMKLLKIVKVFSIAHFPRLVC